MENEIKDAELEILTGENPEEAKKRSRKTELALFLVLGFLIGIVVKTEASKRIVIGFEDFKVKTLSQDYKLSKIQKELAEKAKEEQKEQEESASEPAPEAVPEVAPAGEESGN